MPTSSEPMVGSCRFLLGSLMWVSACRSPFAVATRRLCGVSPKRERHVFVVLDTRGSAGPVEYDRCGVDAGADGTELLLAQPHRGRSPHARKLSRTDRLSGKDRPRASTRSHLANDQERLTSRDHVQLEPADANIAPADLEATLLQPCRHQRFAAARQITSIERAGRGRSSFLAGRRRRSRGPLGK